MEKTRDEVIQDMLSHFHEESMIYGGWPITVKTLDEALIVNEEFKGVLKAMENKTGNNFLVTRKEKAEFKKKHTILVLREKAESYKREADKYYNGMKNLIEG